MIYDLFEEDFIDPKDKNKIRTKVNIYTGEGSAYDIRCGKCEDLIKEIEDDSLHAIITDPPYGVKMDSWDKDMPAVEVWNECYRVLKPGGHIAIFCQPSKLTELILRMSKTEFEFRDQIIWAYQGTHLKGAQTDDEAFSSKIRNVYNPILLYRKKIEGLELDNWKMYRTNLLNIENTRQKYKGDHSSIIKKFEETGEKHKQSVIKSNTYKNLERKGWVPSARGAVASNIQYCPRASRMEKTVNGLVENKHVSVKPVGILMWLIRLLTSSPNQIVADIYCGTGSLGVCCRKANVKFLGIDEDPEIVELAKFRIKHTFDIDEKYFDNIRPI